jgi:hypothetical protein
VLDCTGSTVLSFTETWLKHSTPDRDIKLDSFNVPIKKERVECSFGGVAVYIKEVSIMNGKPIMNSTAYSVLGWSLK